MDKKLIEEEIKQLVSTVEKHRKSIRALEDQTKEIRYNQIQDIFEYITFATGCYTIQENKDMDYSDEASINAIFRYTDDNNPNIKRILDISIKWSKRSWDEDEEHSFTIRASLESEICMGFGQEPLYYMSSHVGRDVSCTLLHRELKNWDVKTSDYNSPIEIKHMIHTLENWVTG